MFFRRERGPSAGRCSCGSGIPMAPQNDTQSEYRLTVFDIAKMDCPSEEGLIRMALEGDSNVKKLSFDLSARRLRAIHTGTNEALLARLSPLNLGARVAESRELSEMEEVLELQDQARSTDESRVLKLLLGINAAMFVIEIIVGWIAQSTGLIADSLDMFADATVYGISLYAVGKAQEHKRRAARYSGYFQLLLALGAIGEVVRRAIMGSEPEGMLMIGMAAVALTANVSCLVLLAKHRAGEVHMRASWIFSTNDVIANLGVILAGVLVRFTGSPWPDLVIGSIIAIVVLSGAIRILRAARA